MLHPYATCKRATAVSKIVCAWASLCLLGCPPWSILSFLCAEFAACFYLIGVGCHSGDSFAERVWRRCLGRPRSVARRFWHQQCLSWNGTFAPGIRVHSPSGWIWIREFVRRCRSRSYRCRCFSGMITFRATRTGWSWKRYEWRPCKRTTSCFVSAIQS